jgi:MYXO-CTERM domain-containing protein
MNTRPVLAALLLAASVATANAGVIEVPMPLGATDIDFRFAPGECIDGIRLGGIGGDRYTFTYRGCRGGDVNRIDLAYNETPSGLGLFGVFEAGAPETLGRTTVAIVDAWWTRNGVFYQPVWDDGSSHVVITVPEPAGWALTLTGLGLAWASQRRRSQPR